jgi:hypothetical protein
VIKFFHSLRGEERGYHGDYLSFYVSHLEIRKGKHLHTIIAIVPHFKRYGKGNKLK